MIDINNKILIICQKYLNKIHTLWFDFQIFVREGFLNLKTTKQLNAGSLFHPFLKLTRGKSQMLRQQAGQMALVGKTGVDLADGCA